MTGAIAGEREGRVHVGVDLSDFGSWMASEQKRIYLLCRRLLQDAEEADSATQDVFLKAYKALQKSSYDPVEMDFPDRWVTRIAVNTCLDRLRSKAWKIWQRRPSAEDEKVILEMTPAAIRTRNVSFCQANPAKTGGGAPKAFRSSAGRFFASPLRCDAAGRNCGHSELRYRHGESASIQREFDVREEQNS
jgi:hypothetical protein